MQGELFADKADNSPLAEKLRPQKLADFLGQSRLLGPDTLLTQSINRREIPSLILWGPPGCGKTTLAEVIRRETDLPFFKLSAVHSGVKEVKAVLQQAQSIRLNKGRPLLFIDEIHRFNKSQQDSLLHALEEGTVTLIGATTENPSFEVNSALLSRCQLLLLAPLGNAELEQLIQRSLEFQRKLANLSSSAWTMADEVKQKLIAQADGDARYLINQVEWLTQAASPEETLDLQFLEKVNFHKPLRYDKSGEEHYNLISALHKSVRGSDPDGALYWLHRMLKGGEDPRYLLRRLQRMAVEDIGLADPQALMLATSAQASYDFLGIPEGLLAIDQLVIYLSLAPKSNSVEKAYFAAEALVAQHGNLPVPRALRNAVNKTGKQLGYGQGYQYDHDAERAYAGQEHLPKEIAGAVIYEPHSRGQEGELNKEWNLLREFRGLPKRNSKG